MTRYKEDRTWPNIWSAFYYLSHRLMDKMATISQMIFQMQFRELKKMYFD